MGKPSLNCASNKVCVCVCVCAEGFGTSYRSNKYCRGTLCNGRLGGGIPTCSASDIY